MLYRERSRLRIRGIAPMLGLTLSVGPSWARADDAVESAPNGTNITWRAPDGCPDRAQVLERVARILDQKEPEDSNVEVVADIERRGNSYRLVIRTRRGADVETRTAETFSCAALGEAAAIIVATALAPDSRAESPSATSASPGETVERPAPSGERPPAKDRVRPRPVAPSPSARPSFGLGVGGVFDVGTLPLPAFGVEMLASGTWRSVEVGLVGALWAPQEKEYSGASGVRFGVVAAGGFGCWMPLARRVRLGLCVGAEMTSMRIDGFGLRQPASARMYWSTLHSGGLAELALASRLFIFGRVDAVFAVPAPRVVLTTVNEDLHLHQPAIPALRLTLGFRADVW